MKEGDLIKFRLDGRVEGEGIFKYSRLVDIVVELTKPCKEFETGQEIIISTNEVIYDSMESSNG